MPAITVHPPNSSALSVNQKVNPLPQALRTPAGLAILEIQGTLNTPFADAVEDDPSASSDTQVGRLVFPDYSPSNPRDDTAWMKRAYLYVGKHQRLTGEVKALPKPLALLRKRTQEDADTQDLEIVEVVRHKIVFAHRPEPVGAD